ncbi:MAG: cytochrome c maturation protein CcmE [Sandaracinaceae bacterium]|jgi:cytochrome c-type biogenesis protein CcmE|nr:cytochrome c maturation protein CcmE [Sandaracinaceae bacterium]
MKVSPVAKVSIVVALLAGGVAFLLLGGEAQNAFVYSKLVNEVMANPSSFRDQTLRVEGTLRQGSIQFRESPCEWRFVIEKQGFAMPVQFPQCIVPDTFRDGVNLTVTVQGRLAADNHFAATQVVPRCPSKYEMQQRQRNGETMPHAGTLQAGGVASTR